MFAFELLPVRYGFPVGISRADTQKLPQFRLLTVIAIPLYPNGVQGVAGSNPAVPTW